MNQKGFSLLEVMIGVAILSGMSLLMYVTMNRALTGKARVEGREEIQHAVRITLDRMVRDLNQAFLVSPALEGPNGIYKTGMKGRADSLDFSTFAHYHFMKDQRDTDQVSVGYSLKKNEAGFYNLLRRESDRLGDKIDEGGQSLVILENVQDLKLTYYHSQKEEWVEEWDTGSVSTLRSLPQAVQILLKVAYKENPESDERPQELIYSTVAAVGGSQGEINF